VAIAKVGILANSDPLAEYCLQAAFLSLILCYFNLIPIPPLDGSQVMRVVTGMSHETFANFARFGFIAIILVLQIPIVKQVLYGLTMGTLGILARIFGVH